MLGPFANLLRDLTFVITELEVLRVVMHDMVLTLLPLVLGGVLLLVADGPARTSIASYQICFFVLPSRFIIRPQKRIAYPPMYAPNCNQLQRHAYPGRLPTMR